MEKFRQRQKGREGRWELSGFVRICKFSRAVTQIRRQKRERKGTEGTSQSSVLRARDMATSPVHQELQALILHTLEKHSAIADTSKLVLPSSSTLAEQQPVQAVLTSLASRNVTHVPLVWRADYGRLSSFCNMNRTFGGLPRREPRLRKGGVMRPVFLMQLQRVWRVSRLTNFGYIVILFSGSDGNSIL